MGEAKLRPMFDATPPNPFREERKKRLGGRRRDFGRPIPNCRFQIRQFIDRVPPTVQVA